MKLLLFSFYLLVLAIPFGTKKFIASSGLLDQPTELNSIFLFGTDILLILFLTLFALNIKREEYLKFSPYLLLFLLLALISVFFSGVGWFSFYQLVKLVLLGCFGFAVGVLTQKGVISFKRLAVVIAASAVFQSLIAISQFKFFRSLGLWFLGEPVVNVFTENVARFRIGDLTFLRSFGTLPHANILAAFLVLGLVSIFYLYLRNNHQKIWYRLILAVGLFFILLALLFTFSRSGWIVAGVVIFLTALWGLLNKEFRRQTANLLIILVAIGYLLMANFGWLALPRVHLSAGEPSVSYRWIYNKIGLEIVKDNLLGVGIGNQLPYAVESNLYRPSGIVRQQDWQPIHNTYLLIASEVGVLGLLAFLVFLFKSVIGRWRFNNLTLVTGYLLLVTLLLFGLVDHFLWSLQSGRLMLWLAIGIVLGNKLLPSSFNG